MLAYDLFEKKRFVNILVGNKTKKKFCYQHKYEHLPCVSANKIFSRDSFVLSAYG